MTSNTIGQQNSNPELKGQEVYQLVSTALQEHFHLDMSHSDYEAQDIFDVLLAACVLFGHFGTRECSRRS